MAAWTHHELLKLGRRPRSRGHHHHEFGELRVAAHLVEEFLARTDSDRNGTSWSGRHQERIGRLMRDHRHHQTVASGDGARRCRFNFM
jgi:hypothetical protein